MINICKFSIASTSSFSACERFVSEAKGLISQWCPLVQQFNWAYQIKPLSLEKALLLMYPKLARSDSESNSNSQINIESSNENGANPPSHQRQQSSDSSTVRNIKRQHDEIHRFLDQHKNTNMNRVETLNQQYERLRRLKTEEDVNCLHNRQSLVSAPSYHTSTSREQSGLSSSLKVVEEKAGTKQVSKDMRKKKTLAVDKKEAVILQNNANSFKQGQNIQLLLQKQKYQSLAGKYQSIIQELKYQSMWANKRVAELERALAEKDSRIKMSPHSGGILVDLQNERTAFKEQLRQLERQRQKQRIVERDLRNKLHECQNQLITRQGNIKSLEDKIKVLNEEGLKNKRELSNAILERDRLQKQLSISVIDRQFRAQHIRLVPHMHDSSSDERIFNLQAELKRTNEQISELHRTYSVKEDNLKKSFMKILEEVESNKKVRSLFDELEKIKADLLIKEQAIASQRQQIAMIKASPVQGATVENSSQNELQKKSQETERIKIIWEKQKVKREQLEQQLRICQNKFQKQKNQLQAEILELKNNRKTDVTKMSYISGDRDRQLQEVIRQRTEKLQQKTQSLQEQLLRVKAEREELVRKYERQVGEIRDFAQRAKFESIKAKKQAQIDNQISNRARQAEVLELRNKLHYIVGERDQLRSVNQRLKLSLQELNRKIVNLQSQTNYDKITAEQALGQRYRQLDYNKNSEIASLKESLANQKKTFIGQIDSLQRANSQLSQQAARAQLLEVENQELRRRVGESMRLGEEVRWLWEKKEKQYSGIDGVVREMRGRGKPSSVRSQL